MPAHFDANLFSTKKVGESAKEVPGEWGSEETEVCHPWMNQGQKHHRQGWQFWKLGLGRQSFQDILPLRHQEPKDTETLLTNIIPGDKRHLHSTQTTCTTTYRLKAVQWPCLTWSPVLWQQQDLPLLTRVWSVPGCPVKGKSCDHFPSLPEKLIRDTSTLVLRAKPVSHIPCYGVSTLCLFSSQFTGVWLPKLPCRKTHFTCVIWLPSRISKSESTHVPHLLP